MHVSKNSANTSGLGTTGNLRTAFRISLFVVTARIVVTVRNLRKVSAVRNLRKVSAPLSRWKKSLWMFCTNKVRHVICGDDWPLNRPVTEALSHRFTFASERRSLKHSFLLHWITSLRFSWVPLYTILLIGIWAFHLVRWQADRRLVSSQFYR